MLAIFSYVSQCCFTESGDELPLQQSRFQLAVDDFFKQSWL